MKNRYPIYIPSKGRHDSCLTANCLEEIGLFYNIVVESIDYDNYKEYNDGDKLLMLPFSNLGQGSIPARNWIWQHALKNGAKRHWVLDDNLNGFLRLNRNQKNKVSTGATFAAIEDFCDRYKNVGLAGMNYRFFAPEYWTKEPFKLNTRIYSCILIDSMLKIRWRGKYNEDTDLSLRVLKSGLCTVLFNAFLCNKIASGKMSGGNTDNVYKNTDSRREFAESLKKQHPELVKIVWRYNRWHHQVNYKPFDRNELIFKKEFIPKMGVDNYGMKKVRV